MNNPPLLSKEEKTYILDAYCSKKHSCAKIANDLNRNALTIKKYLQQNNIDTKEHLYLSEKEKTEIVHKYTVLHKGLRESGSPYTTSTNRVKKVLVEAGVELRNPYDAMATQRKYSINSEYFKTQSHNMAYILGLLASDGCVQKASNDVSIELQFSDTHILEDIQNELQSTRPVKTYTTTTGKKYSKIRFCHRTIKEDLAYYGITPCKTFTLKPPTFLAKEYYISYIRGLFDGDGCFWYDNEREYDNVWSICGASKEVIEWVRMVLATQYGITTRSIIVRKGALKNNKDFYYLNYYGKAKIQRIFEALYSGGTLHLNRKYYALKSFCEI